VIALIGLSCSQEEFNIVNTNQADAKRVLANANDFQNFNISNHSALFSNQIGFQGVFFRGLADQFSQPMLSVAFGVSVINQEDK